METDLINQIARAVLEQIQPTNEADEAKPIEMQSLANRKSVTGGAL